MGGARGGVTVRHTLYPDGEVSEHEEVEEDERRTGRRAIKKLKEEEDVADDITEGDTTGESPFSDDLTSEGDESSSTDSDDDLQEQEQAEVTLHPSLPLSNFATPPCASIPSGRPSMGRG